MMNTCESYTFRSNTEPGAILGCEGFLKPRCCMTFLSDSLTLMRCCGQASHGVGFPKEDPLLPWRLPRHHRHQRGCHGYGTARDDARAESTGRQFTKEGVEILSSYKVREGDTLTSVAKEFGVSIQSIATLNGIDNVDYVPAGKLLLMPTEGSKTGEVAAKADLQPRLVEFQTRADENVFRTQGPLSAGPTFTPAFFVQAWHVRLAMSLLVLVAFSSVVRRYISGLRTRKHDEFLRSQAEKEVQEAYHQPRLRRWQGILDDDRRVNEVDGDSLSEIGAALDVEEENLRRTYAQLESAYVKFLADSGLSKSGYWRGGVPPTLEEK